MQFKGFDKFNEIQNRLLLIGFCIIILLFLVPPWEAANANGNVRAIGHGLIFFPPGNYLYPSLDISRLFIEIIAVIFVTSGAIFFTRDH